MYCSTEAVILALVDEMKQTHHPWCSTDFLPPNLRQRDFFMLAGNTDLLITDWPVCLQDCVDAFVS